MSHAQHDDSQAKDKPWGGRFSEATDAFVEAFTASVNFDKRMAEQDINGSIAHATMLARQGILTDAEREAIAAIRSLKEELESLRTAVEREQDLEKAAEMRYGRIPELEKRIGNCRHCIVLPDDALVQQIFKMHQLVHLSFHQSTDRNTSPLRHHFGDVFSVDFLFQHAIVGLQLIEV